MSVKRNVTVPVGRSGMAARSLHALPGAAVRPCQFRACIAFFLPDGCHRTWRQEGINASKAYYSFYRPVSRLRRMGLEGVRVARSDATAPPQHKEESDEIDSASRHVHTPVFRIRDRYCRAGCGK